jgi:hypothetical protein
MYEAKSYQCRDVAPLRLLLSSSHVILSFLPPPPPTPTPSAAHAGVSFWWMDWQQGDWSNIPGLDPLIWINHVHYRDMEMDVHGGAKRPMLLSRWGGLGNHR